MKDCKDCERTLPLDMFSKNKRMSDGLCLYCRECMAARLKRHRESRTEEQRQHWAEHSREHLKAWRDANAQKASEYDREYRKRNAERLSQYRKDRKEKCPEVRAYIRVKNTARRSAMRVSSFAQEREALIEFYRNCPEGYHVDHIVPLKNPLVCGLHVLANLQYLPAKENLKKRNKFEVV